MAKDLYLLVHATTIFDDAVGKHAAHVTGQIEARCPWPAVTHEALAREFRKSPIPRPDAASGNCNLAFDPVANWLKILIQNKNFAAGNGAADGWAKSSSRPLLRDYA